MTANLPHTLVIDEETHEAVERLAKLWGQPEAEVVKRAVRAADPKTADAGIQERMEAWLALQGSLADRKVDFDEWKRVARESRK
jgi:hypothetical protein